MTAAGCGRCFAPGLQPALCLLTLQRVTCWPAGVQPESPGGWEGEQSWEQGVDVEQREPREQLWAAGGQGGLSPKVLRSMWEMTTQ